mgnify:CR=1 FL=1
MRDEDCADRCGEQVIRAVLFIKAARHVHAIFKLKDVVGLCPAMKQGAHLMWRLHPCGLFKAFQLEIGDVLKKGSSKSVFIFIEDNTYNLCITLDKNSLVKTEI